MEAAWRGPSVPAWRRRAKEHASGRLLICATSAVFVSTWRSFALQTPPLQVLHALAGVAWVEVVAAMGFVVLLVTVAVACRKHARSRVRPLFGWAVISENADEFLIAGVGHDTVEKRGDYKMRGWVIPVNGHIQMASGKSYSWALVFEQFSRQREEIQFGIQGENFQHPWRLITSTRCSRSCDEDKWIPRPGGDRRIKEHDVVHLELDLRCTPGELRMAINDEPFELVFNNIPLGNPMMPAVMLGGHGSRVRVQAASRSSRHLM